VRRGSRHLSEIVGIGVSASCCWISGYCRPVIPFQKGNRVRFMVPATSLYTILGETRAISVVEAVFIQSIKELDQILPQTISTVSVGG
jgi:hypothetical protein